jgi:hypothetical protein
VLKIERKKKKNKIHHLKDKNNKQLKKKEIKINKKK